jgi:3-methyladenine DNA glycosylase AlkC
LASVLGGTTCEWVDYARESAANDLNDFDKWSNTENRAALVVFGRTAAGRRARKVKNGIKPVAKKIHSGH